MSAGMGGLAHESTAVPPNAADVQPRVERTPWAALAAICLLAGGLWAYHVSAAVMISPDSALFIDYARQIATDPVTAVRTQDQHPLYPTLILVLRQSCGRLWSEGADGWILAGRLVGLAGYIGAVLAMYALVARAYERRIGLVAAALLALLPDLSHFGADVLSDTTHLALFLGALATLILGLEAEHRARWLLGSAALSAFAFLARPEGGAVLVIGLAFVVFRRDWRLGRRVILALGMAAVFAVVSLPYQVATGRLVKKKSLPELLQFGFGDAQALLNQGTTPDPDPAGPPDVVYAGLGRRDLLIPVNVLYQWGRALRLVYVFPVLIGLFAARPRCRPGQVLAAAFALHATLLCALQATYGYLDRRHALLLAAFAIPLAAAGLLHLARRIRPAGSPNGIAVGIIGICVLLTSPWLLRPVGRGDEHVRAAARWFAANTPSDALLVGNRRLHRVALCADRAFTEWPWYEGSVSQLAEFLGLRARPVTYVAVDTLLMTTPPRPADFMDALQAELGSRLELAFTAAAEPGEVPTEIRIYAFRETPTLGTGPVPRCGGR